MIRRSDSPLYSLIILILWIYFCLLPDTVEYSNLNLPSYTTYSYVLQQLLHWQLGQLALGPFYMILILGEKSFLVAATLTRASSVRLRILVYLGCSSLIL